jgi:NAD(P)H-dependent FMN reductase
MKRRIHIALIYGSTRAGRFCDTVAAWVAAEIAEHDDFTLDPIDPAKFDLSARSEPRATATVPTLAARIARADAIVVVTPEYNHSYPAALKSLIDALEEEWQAKPVAFVSYGGLSGGVRAVEQLRLVFTELHAATIRDAVSFTTAWEQFDDAGTLREPERARRSMAAMLASLRWWASALRYARRVVPYADRAA